MERLASKPILKWAGGKSSLLKEIKTLFPSDVDKGLYHEPFVGGGALFFSMKPNKGTINDINESLMNFYKVVKEKPEEFINEALKYQKFNNNKNKFNELRIIFNQKRHILTDVELAALFLYFNKTAYNGLYRENSNGDFNVPFGKYKNPKIVHLKRIREANKILQNIDLFCEDFEYVLKVVNTGDFCYLDPPYYQSKESLTFTDYSKKGFTFQDHIRLKKLCVKLHNLGVYFILSNSNSPEIRNLYEKEEFSVKTVTTKWMISCKASSRTDIDEILIYNTDKIHQFKT